MARLADIFNHLGDLYMKYREIPTFQLISGVVLATCVIGALLLLRSAYKSELELSRLLNDTDYEMSDNDIQ